MTQALQPVLAHLPPTVLGGVATRSPEVAIMELMTSLESHAQGRPAPPMVGAALDASKCFDRIRWGDTWRLLHRWNVPS